MRDIRQTFSTDKEFSDYFKSLKWTEGITGRRPNLLNDECMKIILADKLDTRFLASLLAAIIRTDVKSIEILDVSAKRRYLSDREIYFDILANIDGTIVNIEVQLAYQKYFDLRSFWQISSIFSDNANVIYNDLVKEGKTRIRHDEFLGRLPKVICINLCGFNIDKDDADYFWHFGMVDLNRRDRRIVPEAEIIFLELPKFKRLFENTEIAAIDNPLDIWLYFFVLCDTKEKLEEFLSLHKELFTEYEEKIEEVSTMPDFVTRYNQSLINNIVFMTPAEELEYLQEALAANKCVCQVKNTAFGLEKIQHPSTPNRRKSSFFSLGVMTKASQSSCDAMPRLRIAVVEPFGL